MSIDCYGRCCWPTWLYYVYICEIIGPLQFTYQAPTILIDIADIGTKHQRPMHIYNTCTHNYAKDKLSVQLLAWKLKMAA